VASIPGGNNGLIFGTRHGGDAPGIRYGEPRNVQFVLKFLFLRVRPIICWCRSSPA